MISKLSGKITKCLLKRELISCEDEELYNYGLFMIISYLMFFVIAILFGVALNIVIPVIIFYVSFSLVRNFSGGIHAKSEIICDIITTTLIVISEIIIKIFIFYDLIWITSVVLVISAISLCSIKPISSSQKEISQSEKICFHKKVIVLVISSLILAIVGMYLEKHSITISCAISLALANFLLVLGYFQLHFVRFFSSKK